MALLQHRPLTGIKGKSVGLRNTSGRCAYSSSAAKKGRNVQLHVASPVRGDTELLFDALTLQPSAPAVASMGPDDLLKHILAPVQSDVVTMNENLKNVVGNRHPMLLAAAEQIFGAGGKKLRPVTVFLVARATADLMCLRYLPSDI